MKQKSIKERLKEYFFINPNSKLRVRQIEKKIKIPLPSVIRYTKELEEEAILKRIKIEDVVFYTADKASKNYLIEKKLSNIKRIYDSGLVDFLIEELSNPIIILFGSFSKGEDIETSDIDLYIETPSKKNVPFQKYENILYRRIQIFKHDSIQKVPNIHLANNILNGIILNGFEEVFK